MTNRQEINPFQMTVGYVLNRSQMTHNDVKVTYSGL